jgi:hypothetical protein
MYMHEGGQERLCWILHLGTAPLKQQLGSLSWTDHSTARMRERAHECMWRRDFVSQFKSDESGHRGIQFVPFITETNGASSRDMISGLLLHVYTQALNSHACMHVCV